MRAYIVALGLAVLAISSAAAQVPPEQLAQPPADAERWTISSLGGRHGQTLRWTDGDTRWSRESILLRGFVTEVDTAIRLAPDGSLRELIVRGSTPEGDAAESYSVSGGRFQFQSPVDRGEGAAAPATIYASFGGAIDVYAVVVEALLRAPDRSLALLPSGRASLEPLTTLEVSSGGQSKRLDAYLLSGFSFTPIPIWVEGDRFWGFASFLDWIPAGWESVEPQLTAAQNAAMAARGPALVERLAPRAATPIAFRNVRIFDAEALRFRTGVTVVVENGRITAAARGARVPSGARVIDGRGHTLVPGLWDNHQHYGDDGTGPLLLSQGITSVRDPGSLHDEIIDRRRRIEEGQLLGPHILPTMLLDGPGPLSAQVALVVNTPEEAVAAVQRAARDGFIGVKLYGSLDPALVAPIAAEADRLGVRVSGHVPRTMRTLDAARAGYDEITHINFVAMQAMPDSVVNESNGLQRFFGPGRYAAELDFSATAFAAYLDELQQRDIAVDPTLAVFEGVLATDRGQIAAAYAPLIGTLPPQFERYTRAGGLQPPEDLDRATMMRSFARLRDLVGELHRRGITIVAGTDGTGLELVRDLELYVEAGMSPAEALATATIVPAREFGMGEQTGSITVGKRAELVLVEGDVSVDIGALRHTVLVVRDGRVMDADALRAASGIAGRPNR